MNHHQKVSQSPTHPQKEKIQKAFDVADLFKGPFSDKAGEEHPAAGLDEKLRQAYFWITNHAIISPFYDIEYQDGPDQSFVFGDQKITAVLPSGQSYSSYVLLPLLNLAVQRRRSDGDFGRVFSDRYQARHPARSAPDDHRRSFGQSAAVKSGQCHGHGRNQDRLAQMAGHAR